MSTADRKSDKKFDNKTEFGGSKSNVVVMLVLVFFVSLLSFSIGIFVGKKFSDNQYKQAKMEPTSHGDAPAAGDEHAVAGADGHGETAVDEGRHVASVTEGENSKALSDEEIAKLAEEFVTDEEPGKNNHNTAANAHEPANAHDAGNAHEPAAANAHGKPADAKNNSHKNENNSHAKPEHNTSANTVHEAPLPAANKIANNGRVPSSTNGNSNSHASAHTSADAHGTPAAAAAPAAKMPSHLPAETAKSESGKYTVQVASYQDEKEAQNMSAQLKSKGYNSFYVQAHVNNQTWFRVCVGPLFTTLKQADEFKKEIISKKVVSSAIIQKIEKQ